MRKWLKRIVYTLLFLFVALNALIAMQAYHATRYYEINQPKKHLNEMNFGEKASAILLGVKIPRSKITDTLSIPHKSIKLTTEDGGKLAAWDVDSVPAAKGTVVMFHGHGSCRSGMLSEANAFYAMGYKVLMTDFRAHGESDGDICTIGYYESRDVKAAYEYIAAKGEKNIVLWGISLGASTIIKAMHDHAEIKPAKVILEMPFGTLYDAVKGSMRNNHVPEQPASALLTFWGGIEHGFWGFGMNPEDYAKSITCPVLLQRGIYDIRVTARETKAIYNNIPATNKRLVEYADCGHESLLDRQPLKWNTAVKDLLNSH